MIYLILNFQNHLSILLNNVIIIHLLKGGFMYYLSFILFFILFYFLYITYKNSNKSVNLQDNDFSKLDDNDVLDFYGVQRNKKI